MIFGRKHRCQTCGAKLDSEGKLMEHQECAPARYNGSQFSALAHARAHMSSSITV